MVSKLVNFVIISAIIHGPLTASTSFSACAFTIPNSSKVPTQELFSTHYSGLEMEPTTSSGTSSQIPYISFQSPFLPTNKKVLNVLIILNTPISTPPGPIFTKLWDISSLRICADGGANRLYHGTHNMHSNGSSTSTTSTSPSSNRNEFIPDLIKGDLDSLDPAVQQYYESVGVKVERDPDQNSNDLDKALSAIRDYKHQIADIDEDDIFDQRPVQVYVYGAFGGRFDQEMASIQALYRWKDEFNHQITMYTDETCALLLKPNVQNRIYLPFYSDKLNGTENENNGNRGEEVNNVNVGEGPTCGLIPIGCRCDKVETEGFKWNLDGDTPLEFGGLVSTSNRAEQRMLTVWCSQPLVFSAEITNI